MTRALATALTTAALAAALLAAGAGPALAAPRAASPGAAIAASLRKSPLYVDPSLASAFPSAVRASLLATAARAPAPVFIIVVPMVAGGQWASGEQLAAVVHDNLGKPGIYLTPDAEFGGDIRAYTWPSDTDGIDGAPYHAADAAQAVDLAADSQTTTLADKFSRAITLVTSGQAVTAYNAAQRALDAGSRATPAASGASGASGGGLAPVVIALIGIVIVGPALALLIVARRRGRRSPEFLTPHSVFTAARTATEAELREVARRQVIELGEEIEKPGPPEMPDAAREQVSRALDAYEAAGKALDGAAGIPDLAGALVLTRLGQGALAAGRAIAEGRPAPAASPLCFFNPLHGPAAREIHWRALGERRTLDVRACGECAAAAAGHRIPSVLTDRDADGNEIPYYEADAGRSVWAATGYGQFGANSPSADLVRRILAHGIHKGE
jgi:hypothetical protein